MSGSIQEELQKILSTSTDGTKTYDRLSEDMKNNLGAVLNFFLDKNLVHKYIMKFADDYEQFDSKENKKTFRGFFTQWGALNGFNQGYIPNNEKKLLSFKDSGEIYKLSNFELPKEIPYLVGILPSSLFTHVFLRFGYLICDPGAGTAHGKWTHSLQVYMLQEALRNGDIQLTNCDSIVQLMKEISRYERGGDGIFAQLFDSKSRLDYTRPETLMEAILNKELLQSPAMTNLRKKFLAHQKNISQIKEINETEKVKKYEQKFAKNATHYYGFQTGEKTIGFFWGKSRNQNENLIEPTIEKQTYLEQWESFAKTLGN